MVDGCHGERSSRMLTDVTGGRVFSKYSGLPPGVGRGGGGEIVQSYISMEFFEFNGNFIFFRSPIISKMEVTNYVYFNRSFSE